MNIPSPALDDQDMIYLVDGGVDAPLRQEKRAAFARQTAGQRARAEEARAAWDKERAALEAEAAALQVKERARKRDKRAGVLVITRTSFIHFQ